MAELQGVMGGRASYGAPFVTRPFGTMFGCTGGLFGPAGFAGMRASLLLRFRTCTAPESESRGVVVEELVEDFEVNPEKASSHCQHMIEHPDAMRESMHAVMNQMQHERLCQAPGNGNFLCNVTNSKDRSVSFHKPRSYHTGSDYLQCSLSAAKGGVYEVNANIRKRDLTCMESTYATGYLECSRKQLRI